MWLKRKNLVTVQLVGGLGNQLFGYFAGKYLAQVTGAQLQFDISQHDKGFTAHGSNIQSFELPETFLDDKQFFSLPYRIALRVASLLGVNPAKYALPFNTVFSKYTSPVDGFDPNLDKITPPSFIRGYYQTYVYAKKVIAGLGGVPLTLRNPSQWFVETSTAIGQNRSVAVHVRRGDYSKLADEFGMLDVSYYLCGISELERLDGSFDSIWVFSDEIGRVEKEFALAFQEARYLERTHWVFPPEGTDAAESLMLMAEAHANVISNSTYSWWASILNGTGRVVAPSKWFKGKKDPDELIPPEWIRIESVWV